MTLNEFIRAMYLLRRELVIQLLGLLGLLPQRPSTQEWSAFITALYPSVYRGRMDAYRLAEQFYRAERVRQLGRVEGAEVIQFPRRNYPPEALDAALSDAVKIQLDGLDPDEYEPTIFIPDDVLGEDVFVPDDDANDDGVFVPATGTPVQNLPEPVPLPDPDPMPEQVIQIPPALANETLRVIERHVEDAARQAIVDAARHDPDAVGYARVATGAETCAFCLMLVSRGPVYKSADTALLRDGTDEPYHNNCDCKAVPVFDQSNWPGRDEYLEALRIWREQGGTLNSVRRHLYQIRKDEEKEAAEEAA